ncbi:MAG: hypothetical protein M1839_002218 [Geoglossum umbratile]|nr:MAG: hypothetical protein M1839_002218 [Geoglossum umbratile]
MKAGIMTLSFNFTNIQLPNNPFLMPRDFPGGDILQPLQTKAQSAADVAATAVPGAVSKVESAAKAAATAIPGADAIKELIPRNFSLGTKQFCIGFNNRTECKNLPLKISSAIPEAATKILGDQVKELHLEQISTGITSFRYFLILGLVWIAIMTVIFAVVSGICYNFERTGNCQFGEQCKYSHNPRSGQATRRRKAKRNKKQSMDKIDEFFSAYPDFDYDHSASFTQEFYRMCDFFEWDREDDGRKDAREEFRTAMVQEFNSLYGKDVDDISAWQELCQVVHIFPVPDDIETCRERVKETYVNLVDLVERARSGKGVKVFPDLEELYEYTIDTGKFFPKESAYAGGVLKYLLREILTGS